MLALASNSLATEIRERNFQFEDSTVIFENDPTFVVGNFEREKKPATPKLVLTVRQNSEDNNFVSQDQILAMEQLSKKENFVPVEPVQVQAIAPTNIPAVAPLQVQAAEPYESITQCFTKPVYFNFNKSILTKEEQTKLFDELNECKEKKTPLVVVGYTCNIGTVEQNKKISEKRSAYIAKVLRQNGFNVVESVGKPKTNFVTEDPKMQQLNRRVVVAKVEPNQEKN